MLGVGKLVFVVVMVKVMFNVGLVDFVLCIVLFVMVRNGFKLMFEKVLE